MLGFLFPVPHKSSWFLRGFPSHSQQRAPGNNLKPGRFPKGVTDAGAETDENAPHPWETFSSIAETGHWWCFLTLPWLSEPWELRFLLSQITLPHPALAPPSPCSGYPWAALLWDSQTCLWWTLPLHAEFKANPHIYSYWGLWMLLCTFLPPSPTRKRQGNGKRVESCFLLVRLTAGNEKGSVSISPSDAGLREML